MLVRNTGGQLPAFDTTILQTQLLNGGGTLTPNEQSLLNKIQTKFNVEKQYDEAAANNALKAQAEAEAAKAQAQRQKAEFMKQLEEAKNKLQGQDEAHATALKVKDDEHTAALKAIDELKEERWVEQEMQALETAKTQYENQL